MRQRHAARTISTIFSTLLLATTAVVLTGAGGQAAPGGGAGDGTDLRLDARTFRPPAKKAAGFTAYPVPTSAASLGKIVTAPNGDMWFVEADVNQIGRITPAGVITEYDLGPTTTGQGQVYDLTVAPDGSLWVVYDQGRAILHVANDLVNATQYSLGGYPYGEDVEMGPDGFPWVTMSFDEDGLARVLPSGMVWHDNAPPCDGALARAHDGGMWCQSFDRLIRSNADASGGVTYPLPAGASYPYSLAAGPVGSMWFARYMTNSFTSPSGSNVGWVDQATGQTTIFDTGSRTGPAGLTRGPDGAMWFTNRGVGKGIGHLHANGTGAITKVGDYLPTHLTFDHQGYLWFTDNTNNTIVKVDPAQLQVTDVELGNGSVFAVDPTTPPDDQGPPPPASVTGKVKAGKKPLALRGNRLKVRIACPQGGTACEGAAVLRHRKKSKALTRATVYQVAPGRTKNVKLRLVKAGKKAFKKKRTVKVRVTLVAAGGAARDKVVKVRRR